MEIKHYRDSNFLKYEYQAIYQKMLQAVSDDKYSSLDEFSYILEEKIYRKMISLNLDCFPHPSKFPDFQLEKEGFPVYIPENADGSGEELPFFLASLSNTFPLQHTMKPSGFIFEDFSFLQIDLTLAYGLNDKKIYILFYTIHYGRIRDEKEVYFFRYDKESNYQFDGDLPMELNYKPIYHFHGNSDDPHFEDNMDIDKPWVEKVEKILSMLEVNLPRLLDKYKECDYIKTA
ncbi:hypothetical protein [Peribacillus frigoritolerans]|uniref:hypothetical protein n=1 Tax=Peribacillus frigoritolerans TaxID=450367 RepID=UPI00203BB303|nr:hypothetical protein [Peribacillus frigoritolerans]MCM3167932.1 hypothetical protein [Peribacillus frigoritolerans]